VKTREHGLLKKPRKWKEGTSGKRGGLGIARNQPGDITGEPDGPF